MQYYIIFWLATIVIVEAPLIRVTRMLNSGNQKQIPQPMNNKLFKKQTNKLENRIPVLPARAKK